MWTESCHSHSGKGKICPQGFSPRDAHEPRSPRTTMPSDANATVLQQEPVNLGLTAYRSISKTCGKRATARMSCCPPEAISNRHFEKAVGTVPTPAFHFLAIGSCARCLHPALNHCSQYYNNISRSFSSGTRIHVHNPVQELTTV